MKNKKMSVELFVFLIFSLILMSCSQFTDSLVSSAEKNDVSELINKYTVTWKNYDGRILEIDTDVDYGSMPSYDGPTPTKETTNQYHYSFAGWSPKVSNVTCDIIYTAQFVETDLNIFEFTKNSNKFISNNTANEEFSSVMSKNNEIYNFCFANYKSLLGRWGQLNQLGYLYNTTKIKGIDSIIIKTLNSNDKLIISFGYKEIDNEIIFSETIDYNCSEKLLLDNSCNYIKIFNASSTNIIIDSIIVHFKNV